MTASFNNLLLITNENEVAWLLDPQFSCTGLALPGRPLPPLRKYEAVCPALLNGGPSSQREPTVSVEEAGSEKVSMWCRAAECFWLGWAEPTGCPSPIPVLLDLFLLLLCTI